MTAKSRSHHLSLYLLTLSKIGISPQEAMYVGDMAEDMLASHRAETCAVGICRQEGYHTLEQVLSQNPAYIIRNLNELDGIL